MTSQALLRAKTHVNNVCNQGLSITLFRPGTKDEFGTQLTETTQILKAFPIRFNPYDREVLEKISWAENTEILCYVSKLQIDNLSLTVQDLRVKYSGFRFDKKTYDIRYVEPYSAFANDFLYVVIGGKS
jgi:hypothetical protein